MDCMLLLLGGHLLAVEGDCAVPPLRRYAGASPFAAAGGEAEWMVRYGTDLTDIQCGELLNEFVFSETGSLCRFRRDGDVYRYSMHDVADGSQLVALRWRRGECVVDASGCTVFPALRFSLWFAVSMLAASSKMTFVHSSVVVHRGRAVLFLGESGTGKSTHTRLWMKNIEDAHLLNDDSPILTIEEGRPYVYGSPWSGKTPCYVARRFPIAAVVRLSQAPQNRMRRLAVPGAFAALQPSLPPALMQDEPLADQLIDIVSDTVAAVPSFHLECLPDAAAARLCCETIYGEL